MDHFRLQIGCLAVIFFIIFSYYREVGVDRKKREYSLFIALFINAIVWIFFDGLTAYTVNHPESVSERANLLFHVAFMVSIDTMVFLMYIYIQSMAKSYSNKILKWIFIIVPYASSLIFLFATAHKLEYTQGKITNYADGLPVITCYVTVAIYFVFTFVSFFRSWKNIERRKIMSIFVYMAISLSFTIFQILVPESLLTAIVPTIFIIGIYLNHEEPSVKKLMEFNHDTVMDFATLVENRDTNTGGHIKRTTAYVKLLSTELSRRGYFTNYLTKDFLNNLAMAAPMHDIGKIATPDAILQKPGKLTDEEFDIMRKHSSTGAEIIKETFGKHGEANFINMAHDVARYHHEKWNGKGYPDGKKENEIPLSARIMAVADVFDAVSQKRCYRDALPLDQCFEIIKNGRGTDFDPLLVDVFIDIRQKVEYEFYTPNEQI